MPRGFRTGLILALAAGLGVPLPARDFGDRDGADQGQRPSVSPQRPAPADSPMVINLSRPSSGGQNRNYRSRDQDRPSEGARPSWGHLHRQSLGSGSTVGITQQGHPEDDTAQRAAPSGPPIPAGAAAGMRSAHVAHHHAYTLGYVRKRLQKLGVTQEPNYITERSEIIHTDRAHSTINYPDTDADGAAVSATLLAPHRQDGQRIRAQMEVVSAPSWQAKASYMNRTERQAEHYYWHSEGGTTYCHYLDGSGYDWYGWYQGGTCFWARNFVGRWWWYDADFDRWDFYDDGFWWWQDPYHVGDLYCYSEGTYIPVNSQEDQIVVTQPDTVALKEFASPDGTRTVKVVDVSQDAFLYDNASPPTFNPIYLASGVQNVEFSNPDNGRPLEIVLELNDSSFDLFGSQGQPYSQGGEQDGGTGDSAGSEAPNDGGQSN